MEIAPGLHRIECPIGERYIAVHVVVGDHSVAIVDAGYAQSVDEYILPYLEAHHIDRDAVKFLIVTHSDFDHSGGSQLLLKFLPNLLVCAGERDRPMLEDLDSMIDDRYGEFRHDHGFDESEDAKTLIRTVASSTPVHIGLTGGERIDLGDRVIEILHTPGHSWGHVSVLDESTGNVILGDAVLTDTVPLADGTPAFPSTYRFVEAYRATIRMLKGRRPTGLLPAHYPPQFGEDAADFLDVALAYTDLVETVTLETVAGSSAPMSLMEIVESSHGRLGPWGTPAYHYLVYPVLGHLEVLESYGRVQSVSRPSGITAWTAVK